MAALGAQYGTALATGFDMLCGAADVFSAAVAEVQRAIDRALDAAQFDPSAGSAATGSVDTGANANAAAR